VIRTHQRGKKIVNQTSNKSNKKCKKKKKEETQGKNRTTKLKEIQATMAHVD